MKTWSVLRSAITIVGHEATKLSHITLHSLPTGNLSTLPCDEGEALALLALSSGAEPRAL